MSHSSIALTSMIYMVVTILVVSHRQIMRLEKVYSADPSVGRSIGYSHPIGAAKDRRLSLAASSRSIRMDD